MPDTAAAILCGQPGAPSPVGRVEREPRPVAQMKRHLERHYPKDVTPADPCRLTGPGVNLALSER
ncbi:hypothetical protein [Calidithermus chliarophilus]|uniref:hypothetical protein n=1 Tax=Calidithermus chliarophilus TaxID=52023 RepID=UPI0012F64CE2|nr:hypothetical protein [Calidithermus chliarophilus]